MEEIIKKKKKKESVSHSVMCLTLCDPYVHTKSLAPKSKKKKKVMPNSHRWRRKGQPTGVFLCGEFYEPRSLAGESPQGRREWTPEQLTFFLKHS